VVSEVTIVGSKVDLRSIPAPFLISFRFDIIWCGSRDLRGSHRKIAPFSGDFE
jgi:hypothetical protein